MYLTVEIVVPTRQSDVLLKDVVGETAYRGIGGRGRDMQYLPLRSTAGVYTLLGSNKHAPLALKLSGFYRPGKRTTGVVVVAFRARARTRIVSPQKSLGGDGRVTCEYVIESGEECAILVGYRNKRFVEVTRHWMVKEGDKVSISHVTYVLRNLDHLRGELAVYTRFARRAHARANAHQRGFRLVRQGSGAEYRLSERQVV